MTVRDIQSVIDLLGESTAVSGLVVTCADGSSATIKRAPAKPATEMVRYESALMPYEVTIEELSADDIVAESGAVGGIIAAPLVGAFHGTNPPVAAGSLIRLGQIVGYIESMKLMSELKADIEGVIVEVLIADRQPVEYAQPLFRVMPSEE